MVVVMEVCVDSIESAINAARGGASRLELCCALSEGGLTPSPGMLEVVKSSVSIPVYAMLRPRSGGDFIYSDKEVEILKIDAMRLKAAGADGFVFGALDKYGNIDQNVCETILSIVSPLPVTFHRAFDVTTSNAMEALEIIIRLGFQRLLTSGQALTAEEGIDVIKSLIRNSRNRIIVMPGAGITEDNVANILCHTGATEFHASARCRKELVIHRDIDTQMGFVDDSIILVASESRVRRMRKIANEKREFTLD